MPNPKTITERLTKDFEKLNLEQPAQLHRLLRRCEADLATLRRAQAAVAEQADKAGEELDQYEKRRQELFQSQDRLAAWVEERSRAPEVTSRSQAAAELRQVQIDLRMLGREKKDWELTAETMRHFAADVKEAIGIVGHIIGSLKRNLDRLKVAALLRGEDESKEKFVSVAGIDFEVDLSQATSNKKYHRKLLALAKKIQQQMNSIARKCKFQGTWIAKNDSFRFDRMDLIFCRGEVGLWQFRINDYDGKHTLPELVRDHQYKSFCALIKVLPAFIMQLERELREGATDRREEFEELSLIVASLKAKG